MRRVGVDMGRLDVSLSSLAREEASLRLRVGQTLEVLSRGAVSDLGFSSLSAYVLERCDRSVRWAEGARCLARRLERLPALRRALAAGLLSWSMAELVARVALREDESWWLAEAESRTVRQMRVLVAHAVAARATSFGAAETSLGAVVRERWLRGLDSTVPRGGNGSSGADAGGADAGDSGGHRPHDGCRLEGSAWGEDGTAGSGAPRGAADAYAGNGEREGVDGMEADGDKGAGACCAVTVTMDREDAWLFEATRSLLGQLGVQGADAMSEALLAEGLGTLLATLPEGALDLTSHEGSELAQRRWAREVARWRVEAEALSEDRFCGLLWTRRDQAFPLEPFSANEDERERRSAGGHEDAGHEDAGHEAGSHARADEPRSAVAAAAARGMASLEKLPCAALDRLVRALSRALARHELEVSRLALQFHRADGWRRLGYATEAQYARERLGCSISALRGRRSLALRLETLPRVAAALGTGEIGVEAALQIVRVAAPRTQAAWVERARRRTVKHLREEVAAALVAMRCSGEVDCTPPTDPEMQAFERLEQAVVSGRACPGIAGDGGAIKEGRNGRVSMKRVAELTCEKRRAWYVMLSSLARWLEGGLQLSAGSPPGVARAVTSKGSGSTRRTVSAGRVTLRLRMSRELGAWWRGLEAQARRWLPREVSWVRFLCLSVWETWGHLAGVERAYSEIYERDRYRCLNPVCNQRNVTPHHIRFRSAGGSDEPKNVAALCWWCHLEGVHGGRIRATGEAPAIHWEIGAGVPCLVVHGRERLVA